MPEENLPMVNNDLNDKIVKAVIAAAVGVLVTTVVNGLYDKAKQANTTPEDISAQQ